MTPRDRLVTVDPEMTMPECAVIMREEGTRVLAVIGDGFHHLVAHVLKAPQLLRVLLPARVVFVVPCAAAEHW